MAFIVFSRLILFENENYIIINKPSQISTLDERNESINVLQLAKKYNPSAQVCHRLDKDTSGVLVIAKNPEAYRNATMQFEAREVEKIYHAIIGTPRTFDHFLVNLPIRPTSSGTVKIDKQKGKQAISIFSTLRLFKHYALVQCLIKTGRMHQIRIHLASQNASIASDTTYKGKIPYLSEIKKKFKNSEEEEIFHRKDGETLRNSL